MKYKFQYKNEQERQDILNENVHMTLVEEQNITQGNFLVFLNIPPNYEETLGDKVLRQEVQIADLNLQDISMIEMLIERGLI